MFTVPGGTRVPKGFEGLRLTRLGSIVRGAAGGVNRWTENRWRLLAMTTFGAGPILARREGQKPRPTEVN